MDASSEAERGGCSASPEDNLENANAVSGGVSIRPTPLINPNDVMNRMEQGANALKDMIIAHEIAMDGEFRLKQRMPPVNSLEQVITDTIKRAFWDILRTELAMNPPKYDQAFRLLEDVKIGLSNAILPHQTKFIQNINEVLDSDVIKQQAQAGVLDFQAYSDYVLNMMLKVCASARDEKIAELQQCTDVVEKFKGILEILDLMKLDLANTSIQIARPDIILHSIQYEKNKFNEFIKSREGLEDCLRYTKVWLYKHMGTADNPKTTEQVLTSAYLELLEWSDDEIIPETLSFDKLRILEIRGRFVRLICTCTIYTLAVNQFASLKEVTSLKQSLQSNIITLMSPVQTNENFNEILPNLILQISADIKKALFEHGHGELSNEEENAMQARLNQVSNPNHNVRMILKQRMVDYLRLCLESTRGPIGVDIPAGWNLWRNDILPLAAGFSRLTIHNRGVFGEHYINIIEGTQRSTAIN